MSTPFEGGRHLYRIQLIDRPGAFSPMNFAQRDCHLLAVEPCQVLRHITGLLQVAFA